MKRLQLGYTANEHDEFDEPSARAPFAVGDTTAETGLPQSIALWEKGDTTKRMNFRIYAEVIKAKFALTQW